MCDIDIPKCSLRIEMAFFKVLLYVKPVPPIFSIALEFPFSDRCYAKQVVFAGHWFKG